MISDYSISTEIVKNIYIMVSFRSGPLNVFVPVADCKCYPHPARIVPRKSPFVVKNVQCVVERLHIELAMA